MTTSSHECRSCIRLIDRVRTLEAQRRESRRAIIAELIGKLDALPGLGWIGYKAWTRDWLRAELAEGGDGE